MQRIIEPDTLQLEFGRRFPSVLLASSSPNRRALLEKGGTHVDVFIPDADETKRGSSPEEIVMSIAERKIDAYIASSAFSSTRLAIAADTLVLINGHLLGKPQDKCDAERILRELSGAYRLQKTGYEPVEKIDGNWTTIVGLPLKKIMDSI